ncbi:Uma2 family endonuclease [Desulfococcaceae bacterium HSG8]|nr:Uma2 family endonuclease [Desulfococcaceae bacterium HSG8]
MQETERDTVVKKSEYESVGVKEYYILDANVEDTACYRLDESKKYEKIRPVRDIIVSSVLPGFQFRISDLYRQPSLEDMAVDEVYHYVFSSYKKQLGQERQRSEQAEKLLSMERQRAEQEKQRADRLEAKLRELGISLE